MQELEEENARLKAELERRSQLTLEQASERVQRMRLVVSVLQRNNHRTCNCAELMNEVL